MTPPAHVQRIVDLVDGSKRSGRGWVAKCPCHADRNPSLGITVSDDDKRGRANLHCFAGCDSDDVRRALGLAVADLYADATRNGVRILRRHRYHDEFGEVLYEVRVLDRSTDRYRIYHPTATGWAPKRGSALPVLYRLPDVIRSAADGDTVFACEGERDADAMAADGFVATTIASGSWRDVDTSHLKGRLVFAVLDNDRGGWNRGLATRNAVAEAGGLFEAVRPPDDCNDVAEMVEKGYCLTTDLVPVDLDGDQPPVENRHRRNEQSIDRSAFLADGRPVFVQMPSGLLLSFLQAGRLTLDDVTVFMLLEERAGRSSLAKMSIADVQRVLGWTRWHRAGESMRRLEAVGLIAEIKRGHWRVYNPCWPGREPEHLDRNAVYRNRREPLPPSSPSNPNESPASRRQASTRPPERVETPPVRVGSTSGQAVAT